MTPELAEACSRAVHVRTIDGQWLKAGRAGLFLFGHMGYPKLLIRLASLPPFIWCVELGYYLITRNRGRLYRWFVKRWYTNLHK